MSYYFPFRGSDALSVQTIPYALSAITASVPISSTITALTASYAMFSGSTPLAGAGGLNITQFACDEAVRVNPKLLISGSPGAQGQTGSVGANNNTCPTSTIECTELNVSLSMALPGFPNGINHLRPSGSRFSKVCMQIPPGCTNITAVCPPYLPTASITTTYPSIP